jgi:hypothetical protein
LDVRDAVAVTLLTKDFLNTPDGQEVAANAAKISTGGPPAVIFAEDDTHQL